MARLLPGQFPEQNEVLWKMFFYLTGISNMFIFNSILALSNYWRDRIHEGVEHYVCFYWMIGTISAFFVFNKINKFMSLQTHMMLWPTMMTIILYIYLILGELMIAESLQTLKLVIFLALVTTQGFMTNMLGISNNRYVLCFSSNEIASLAAGGGMVGLGCSIITFTLSYAPVSVTMQYVIYLVCVTGLLAFIQITTFYYMKRYVEAEGAPILKSSTTHALDQVFNSGTATANAVMNKLIEDAVSHETSSDDYRFDLNPTEQMNKKALTTIIDSEYQMKIEEPQSLQASVREILQKNQEPETWAERWQALQFVYTIVGLLFFTDVASLGVFPALSFITGIGMAPKHGYPLIVLLYKIGDLCGKFSYKKWQISDYAPLYIYGILRNFVIPMMFMLCIVFKENAFMGSPVVSITLMMILAYTNGHYTTGCFATLPKRLSDDHRRCSGYILLISTLLGLYYGSMVDYIALTA